jgi:hypothetical protein
MAHTKAALIAKVTSFRRRQKKKNFFNYTGWDKEM